MNNPHNMSADKNQDLFYQTQWFDKRTTIFDRTCNDGTKTDELYIALNGEDGVTVVSPNPDFNLEKFILLQSLAAPSTRPHDHWMSSDDRFMVTPEALTGTTTIYDMMQNKIVGKVKTDVSPVAVGMMPDGSKSYVADFFDSTISVINTANVKLIKKVNSLQIMIQ
jgi:YVTN family beta-propeller protein